jgi:uncharacterized membrane protein (DUF4010 family)
MKNRNPRKAILLVFAIIVHVALAAIVVPFIAGNQSLWYTSVVAGIVAFAALFGFFRVWYSSRKKP